VTRRRVRVAKLAPAVTRMRRDRASPCGFAVDDPARSGVACSRVPRSCHALSAEPCHRRVVHPRPTCEQTASTEKHRSGPAPAVPACRVRHRDARAGVPATFQGKVVDLA
jgi:hypothetical protein